MKISIFKEYLLPIVVLTAISLFITAAVVLTYHIAAPILSAGSDDAASSAKKEVLPGVENFVAIELEQVDLMEIGVLEIHKAEDNSGMAIKAKSFGYYGDDLVVMVGLDPNGTIVGVKVVEQHETNGLGTKATVPEYTDQFIGKSGNVDDIAVISGATISSTAVKTAINHALAAFELTKGVLSA